MLVICKLFKKKINKVSKNKVKIDENIELVTLVLLLVILEIKNKKK